MPAEFVTMLLENLTQVKITARGGKTAFLGVPEVDKLIRTLLDMRAQMHPQIPKVDPAPGEPFHRAEGWWAASLDRDRAQIAVFVAGLGWAGLDTKDGEASRIVGLITSAPQPTPHLN